MILSLIKMLSLMDYLTLIMSVFAGSSVVLMISVNLYFKIRRKFPTNVNCWFCNANTKVPYESQNSWECPFCDQYNGFTTDGNYNKTIPAQHDEDLNNPVTPKQGKKLSKNSGNGLCWKCNCNQELKIYQLACFSPINPHKYEEEINGFRKRLEKEYKLCNVCEGVLANTLNKQRDWILSLNLESLRKKKMVLKKTLAPKVKLSFQWIIRFAPVIVRNLLVILSGWISLAHAVNRAKGASPYISYAISLLPIAFLPLIPLVLIWEFIIAGVAMFVHVFAALASHQNKSRRRGSTYPLYADMVCCLLWLTQQTVSWLSRPETTEWALKQINAVWMESLDFGSILAIVSYFTMFSQAIVAIVPRPATSLKNSSKANYSFKHLNIRKDKPVRTYSGEFSDEEETVTQKNTATPVKENKANLLKEKNAMTAEKNKQKSSSPTHYSNILNPLNTSSFSVSDGDELDISNLSLGPINVTNDIKAGQQSSPKFVNRTKPVIQPARLNLKNIVQSSWVAGGYWQVPNSYKYQFPVPPPTYHIPSQINPCPFYPYNGTPLSRSSSQSSGFVSQSGASSNAPMYSSNSLPGSTSSSTCGDQENCSVFSEPAYHKNPSASYYGNIFSGNHTQSSLPYAPGHPLYGMVSAPLPIFPHYPGFFRREPVLNVNHCCCCQALPPKSIQNSNAKSLVEDSDSHSTSSGFSDTLSRVKTKANHGSSYKVHSGKLYEGKNKIHQPAAAIWSVLRENVFLLLICGISLMFNALMLYMIFMDKGTWLFTS